jgi:crotonobetainyl-CoA:carnitine CoA-transferase CaiB-like acyl-CoA transferase
VWENFRPGVMERLGLGCDVLRAINPRLIYCAVSGFGQNGPERGTAAFDGKLQAMSGIMSITGHEDKGPTRAGFALCDTIGGMTAAFAVASALYQRSHTGEGQLVDVAMLDAALGFLAGQVAEYTVAGHIHRQFGNLSTTGKVTGNRFKAGEGDLMLAVMTEKQFANLMRGLGREDVLDDARFADWQTRRDNEPALRAIIEAALASDSAKNWEARLTAADVPCAAIWAISEIVHHPQLAHRDVLQQVEAPYGHLTVAGSGFRFGHDGGAVDRPPPLIGEHTDEVLAEAGYTADEITGLREQGVI